MLANIHVGYLDASQASKLIADDGMEHPKLSRQEYSLAEVYEIKRLRYVPDI